MTNQCGNGNYLGQPAWDPAPEPMSWYANLWTVICSYWMPGEPLPLEFTKQQKREFGKHVLIALAVTGVFVLWVVVMAYGQPAIRGY